MTETTGAWSRALESTLRALAAAAATADGTDTTVYGRSRASPRSFYGHHAAAVSNAIVAADSTSLRQAARTLAREALIAAAPCTAAFA